MTLYSASLDIIKQTQYGKQVADYLMANTPEIFFDARNNR